MKNAPWFKGFLVHVLPFLHFLYLDLTWKEYLLGTQNSPIWLLFRKEHVADAVVKSALLIGHGFGIS